MSFRESFCDIFGKCQFVDGLLYPNEGFVDLLYRIIIGDLVRNRYEECQVGGTKTFVKVNTFDLAGRDKKRFYTIKGLIQSKVELLSVLRLEIDVEYICVRYTILGFSYTLIGIVIKAPSSGEKWEYLRYFHI